MIKQIIFVGATLLCITTADNQAQKSPTFDSKTKINANTDSAKMVNCLMDCSSLSLSTPEQIEEHSNCVKKCNSLVALPKKSLDESATENEKSVVEPEETLVVADVPSPELAPIVEQEENVSEKEIKDNTISATDEETVPEKNEKPSFSSWLFGLTKPKTKVENEVVDNNEAIVTNQTADADAQEDVISEKNEALTEKETIGAKATNYWNKLVSSVIPQKTEVTNENDQQAIPENSEQTTEEKPLNIWSSIVNSLSGTQDDTPVESKETVSDETKYNYYDTIDKLDFLPKFYVKHYCDIVDSDKCTKFLEKINSTPILQATFFWALVTSTILLSVFAILFKIIYECIPTENPKYDTITKLEPLIEVDESEYETTENDSKKKNNKDDPFYNQLHKSEQGFDKEEDNKSANGSPARFVEQEDNRSFWQVITDAFKPKVDGTSFASVRHGSPSRYSGLNKPPQVGLGFA